jgi:hypothetical protein
MSTCHRNQKKRKNKFGSIHPLMRTGNTDCPISPFMSEVNGREQL